MNLAMVEENELDIDVNVMKRGEFRRWQPQYPRKRMKKKRCESGTRKNDWSNG